MRFHDQILSEEDFEQLPPTLQRKTVDGEMPLGDGDQCYGFSEFGSLQTNPTATGAKTFGVKPGSTHIPARAPGTRSLYPSQHRSLISPSTTLVDPWKFAALPQAIQRKHFSPEEQYYIASRLSPVILDATDEALYKQYQQSRKSSDIHPFDFGFEDTEGEGFVEEEDLDGMDMNEMESFRWLDNDNDLDLRLDDYHAISAELNSKHPAISPTRRSFRRGLSFSNASFRRRSSSSTSLQSPPPIGSNINKSIPPPAFSLPESRQHRLGSTTSIDLSATHYQDPAAKLKLRVYLASPQKFDEALEFGFPSLHKDAVHSPVRPKTSPGNANVQPKTFFADDTPSLSEDESRDGRSDYRGQDSPRTPVDMCFPNRPSQKSSTDRSSHVRPRVVREVTESYAQASASDREMTLRMTLTRPELRVLEETDHTKPVTINETPLEKAPLTVPVGETRSIWDDLPEEPSRMKRFFKKLKGRA
ncbi:hypothetical protein OHC33_010699 [Knufia fluminis]|uniref:Uncharacterized protein n=1 Tax=Knufia fluminis TaxID=191047 RepID=A0AAN8E9B0_9EURO|nr:hypothetical protein OHC33_010699 [Knufia fluminis]